MIQAIQTFADWVPVVVAVATAICIFILAPLAIFRRTRGVAGLGLWLASFIFGGVLWIYGAVATFAYWGWIGLVIGLLVVGIGVVPMGFVALAVQGQWEWVAALGVLLVSLVVSRLGGIWLMGKAEGKKNAWTE
jgi:hypothetical protein